METTNQNKKSKTKHPLAWIALTFIIVGLTSFSNHPIYGYISVGLGFAMSAYVELILNKKREE